MKKVLTIEMESYFIANAMSESVNSMSRRFNVSDSVVKTVYKKHNIKVPRELQLKFKAEAQKRPYSFSEDCYLVKNLEHKSQKQIAIDLGRSCTTVGIRCKTLGLETLTRRNALKSYIKKGQTPPNKGKKQSEYMSPEAIEKTKATRFKKEQLPKQTLPVWSEVKRKRKNGREYIMIKVPGNTKLVYKHIWMWESFHNKKLPAGFNVVFKNGNPLDCVIENLECVSDATLMKRNTIHNYPEELKKAIRLSSKISKKIKQKK